MNEFFPLFKQFGIWVSILILIAYFLLRHWWPYWKQKDTQQYLDRKAVLDRMMIFQEGMTDALRANNRLSEKISDHIEELTDEIRHK